MLPRITFNNLSIAIENAVKISSVGNAESAGHLSVKCIPAIPPRETTVTNSHLPGSSLEEKPSWYVVMSPREVRGIAGPFSVSQLRQMYKYGEVTDKSLLWNEGDDDWHSLIHQKFLRPKLLQMPQLPPRIGSYNAELAVFDPILALPSVEAVRGAVDLPDFSLNRFCVKCGGLAQSHLPQLGEQLPDLYKCREEVGASQYASEILPGFLWVGNAGSSKKRSLLQLGITLLVNCGDNMNNPLPHPPFYRCREAPLREKPVPPYPLDDTARLLELFERVHDWIELERLYPEHAARADPLPKPYRGPTDKHGFPVKQDKPFRKLENGDKAFPSRVLLWSRLGMDRACVLAAAYLIRQYGVTVNRALDIVKSSRPGCTVSEHYLHALSLWSQRHSLGTLFCEDCKSQGLQKDDERISTETTAIKIASTTTTERRIVDDQYDAFVELTRSRLPLLIRSEEEVRALVDCTAYLSKVPSGFSRSSPWLGLVDLRLSGMGLSDLTVAVLIQLLEGSGVARHLRAVDLSSNRAGPVALKALLVAFFPIDDMEEGEEYCLDEAHASRRHQLSSDNGGEDSDSESASAKPRGPNELMLLNLSHNQLNESAVKSLCFFLKQIESLTVLNVADTGLDDGLCSDIVACLERPLPDFAEGPSHGVRGATVVYGDDDSLHSGDLLPLHNNSVTSLDIGYNKMGPLTASAIGLMLRNNSTLSVLRADLCPGIPPGGFRDISSCMRVYNSALTELSLAGTPLTVKSAEYVMRALDSMEGRICKLDLSGCGLKHLHAEAFAKFLPTSRHLRRLDISGNPFSDKGAMHLAEAVRGKRDFDGIHCPPLQHLDLSGCGFTTVGCASIVEEISRRSGLRWLDLSFNDLNAAGVAGEQGSIYPPAGSDSHPSRYFLDCLAASNIYELHMASVQLRSAGAVALFELLSDGDKTLTRSLRCLYLPENRICDSAAAALCSMLSHNSALELLDLGFNEFTQASAAFFREAVKVNSAADRGKKVLGLSVNMVGNRCDPYVLETPGLARAKNTMLFGMSANEHDGLNRGFSHVPQRSRGNFLVRRELDAEYRRHFPASELNSLV